MRASIYVLGPLLSRFGEAKVSLPGGCAIGARPIDLHLFAMKKLGVNIEQTGGDIYAKCKNLKGGEISFSKSSVGATCNALMAAVQATGQTIINNAAIEPEIDSLIEFLARMGAHIKGVGTAQLIINGVKKLIPVTMQMMPDRIEAGTFMLAAAITGGRVFIKNAKATHLKDLITKMKNSQCEICIEEDGIWVERKNDINTVNIKTSQYPGFPTDLQAQFMAYLLIAKGSSKVEETIFEDRFMHVPELNRLNAKISESNGVAIVNGVNEIEGATIMATDLRASAALVIAGLVAKGTTTISRIYHIDRGYFRIEERLRKIGADIKRVIA